MKLGVFLFTIGLLLRLVSETDAADIRPEVMDELKRNTEVPIIITLKVSPSADFLSKPGQDFLATVEAGLLAAIEPAGFQTGYRYSNLPLISGRANPVVLALLSARPDVQTVELDMRIQGNLCESVPLIQADYVQNTLGYDGTGTTVGFLDTGIDTDHPNFAGGRIVGQQHFLDQGANVGPGAEDDNGHGSNVAGIIGGSGTIGCKGMAPACRFVAVKVLKFDNTGWVSDWVAGLNWIISNNGTLGVDVINASLGTFALYSGDCASSQSAMSTAVTALRNMGILTFCSSGNQGSLTQMSAPACLGNAVAVGASYDANLGREPDAGTYNFIFGGSWPACFDDPANAKKIACFTNRNPGLDLLAPGRPITSAFDNGGLATYTGTSQASPHCAGLAALMLQANSAATPTQILAAMQQTGDDILDAATGLSFKHINARAAVEGIIDSDGDGVPNLFDNCPALVNTRGDMNGDRTLTPSDAVLMLNCVFLAAGSCDLCFSDLNCSSNLTPSDMVIELNAIFLGAPFPC